MATQSILTIKGNPPTAAGQRLSQLIRWMYDCLLYRLSDAAVQPARGTTYFYATAGNNSNDGRDGLGLNISGGTYTASTRTLTKTGAFTSYTWAKNDLIYLSSGVTAGLYKIESKTDANNVVLSATADTYEGSRAAPTSDATGIASSNGPRATIANAYSTLTASTGSRDMRIRLKSGNTWNESAGFTNINACTNFTIDRYGSGHKPILSYFNDSITSGAWTNTSGNVYSHAAPGTVTQANMAWIREKNNIFRPYHRIDQQGSDAANIALVGTIPFSFCIDVSNVIYINMGGFNPNTVEAGSQIGFEVTKLSTSTPGLYIGSGDGILIKDIAFHGFNQNFSAQAYGVVIGCQDYGQIVIDGVESYYSGYHPIGTATAGSFVNGVFTIVNCKAGYATPWTGETMINLFSQSGGSEFIVHGCEVPYGTLPSDRWAATAAAAALGRGQAFFGHTAGGTHALQIVMNCRSGSGEAFACPDPVTLSGFPTVTVRTDVRGFLMNHRVLQRQYNTNVPIAFDGMMTIGCDFNVLPNFKSQEGFAGQYSGGYAINCKVTADCSLQTNPGGTGTYQQAGAFFHPATSPKVDFCTLSMVNAWNRIGFGPPDFTATTGYLWKSIISSTTRNANSTFKNTNDAAHVKDNAWCGRWDESTFSADTNRLMLAGALHGDPHRRWEGEGATDQLCHDGFICDVDFYEKARPSAASIGAVESNPYQQTGDPMKETSSATSVATSTNGHDTILTYAPTKSATIAAYTFTNNASSATSVYMHLYGKRTASAAAELIRRGVTPIAAGATGTDSAVLTGAWHTLYVKSERVTSGNAATIDTAEITV